MQDEQLGSESVTAVDFFETGGTIGVAGLIAEVSVCPSQGMSRRTMAFTFFFSYARANRRNCERQGLLTGETSNLLDQLFDELVSLVHDDLGGERSLIGYRDVEELRIGDPWPQRLSEAICTAKVLVAVFTPSYFQSVNCGREFNVFLRRADEHRAKSGDGVRTPIVPVFWTDELSFRRGNYDPISRYLRDIQHRQQGMPARYPSEGCRRLMDLRQQDYRSLTYAVKDAVCDLASCDLAALEGAGNFHELPSAFAEEFVEARIEPQDLSLAGGAAAGNELPPAVSLPLLHATP